MDDHGQDNSIALLKKHIEKNGRRSMFRFAETAVNSGPGLARNVGLHVAQGSYVAFLDSDDSVEPTMYEELYNKAIQQAADICYCHIQQVDILGKPTHILRNKQTVQGIFSPEEKRHFLVDYISYFTSYIYRRDFLQANDILFPPEKSAEDSYFVTCCILCAERIASVDKALYRYTYVSNSLSRRKDDKRYLDKLSVFNRLLAFARAKGIYADYANELQFIYLKKAYLMAALSYLSNTAKPQAEILKNIYRALATVIPNYKNNPYYKNCFKIRLLVAVLKTTPRTAAILFPKMVRLLTKAF